MPRRPPDPVPCLKPSRVHWGPVRHRWHNRYPRGQPPDLLWPWSPAVPRLSSPLPRSTSRQCSRPRWTNRSNTRKPRRSPARRVPPRRFPVGELSSSLPHPCHGRHAAPPLRFQRGGFVRGDDPDGVRMACVTLASHSRCARPLRDNGSVSRFGGGEQRDRLRVLILGSTGSIGTQALEVIAANPDRFEVVGLAAGGGNPGLLAHQRAETGVTDVAVADAEAAAQVGDVTYSGPDAVTRLVENACEKSGVDVVLNALVGALGLKPTLAALAGGARLALANKAAKPGQIVPVDSEHSAMAQCLRGGTADEVAKIVLTASGGPFLGWSAADLDGVTPEQAGKH